MNSTSTEVCGSEIGTKSGSMKVSALGMKLVGNIL